MIYLIIFIIVILIITGCLWMLYKWYKEEQQEKDARINMLEVRFNDNRKFDKKMYEALIETINDYYDELNEEIKLVKKQLKKKSDKNE